MVRQINDLISRQADYKLHNAFPSLGSVLQINFTVFSMLLVYKIYAFVEARSEISYYFGIPVAIQIMIKLMNMGDIIQQ